MRSCFNSEEIQKYVRTLNGCYGSLCNGCNESEGKVFHAPEGKACAIYECAVNEKHMKSCGECKEVPCHIWLKTRDPQFSDEQFKENVDMRVRALKEAKKM